MGTVNWRCIDGEIYRLVGVFDSSLDSISLSGDLKSENRVFISQTNDKKWAVYCKV